jgi:hypothetical protein
MNRSKCIATLGVVICAILTTPEIGEADASCVDLTSRVIESLSDSRSFYTFDLTLHRTNTAWVSYSSGTIGLNENSDNASWPLFGSALMLFSVCFNGTQPFDVDDPGPITVKISQSGALFLSPHGPNSWAMTCTGNTSAPVSQVRRRLK